MQGERATNCNLGKRYETQFVYENHFMDNNIHKVLPRVLTIVQFSSTTRHSSFASEHFGHLLS